MNNSFSDPNEFGQHDIRCLWKAEEEQKRTIVVHVIDNLRWERATHSHRLQKNCGIVTHLFVYSSINVFLSIYQLPNTSTSFTFNSKKKDTDNIGNYLFAFNKKQKTKLDWVLNPLGEWSMLTLELNSDSVRAKSSFSTHALVVLTVPLGESPLAGGDDDLTSWELELGTTEGLNSVLDVLENSNKNLSVETLKTYSFLDSHGEEDISNVDTGDQSLWLSVSSTHSSLESISSGT
ncbi:hypothetical protein GCK72_005090 [Caenorhabditis remanei]|uniref:Uncharacterized protein n=1 Tax=Caenorhabditis remanei TaxID=31234 RepID=A0A6A5HBG6_CAERE|nr:hypothetical protein GCK72_005090 [Caenorhabditis remanei]KAF1765138.1 hypothetical protein GCK72_005090 [Caenorhabditis remanei]